MTTRNSHPSRRHRLALAALGLLLAGAVHAQARLPVDLPAQPLDQALQQLARSAGVQVFFSATLTEGRQAPALKGSYSAREALEKLLAGSGLVLSSDDERSFTIAAPRRGDSGVLPTLRARATGSDPATGVVGGYAARASGTATKTDTPLLRTPQSISVIPQEQIADQAAHSVAEALRYTSGVFTEYRGASNLHDEMVLRGFQYAPRYLNGLLYGSGSLGQVDPYLVERVELLRGPSSVLYGQASPGGIVNLITKQPDPQARQEVVLGAGNRGRAMLGADLGGVLSQDGTLSWRLAAMAERTDLQEDHLEQRRFALTPSLLWKPDARTELRVQAFIQHEPDAGFRNFMEAAGTLTPTAQGFIPRNFLVSDPHYDRSTRDQAALGYQFRHQFDGGVQFRQNLRLNNIESDYRTLIWNALQSDGLTITRMASGGSEDMRQLQLDNQLQADLVLGGVTHKLLAGLDLRHARRDYEWGMNRATTPSINWMAPVYNVSNVVLTPNSDSRTTARQAGLYLQDQIEVGALSLVLGGRQDWARTTVDEKLYKTHDRFKDSAFSGRVGAVYQLGNGLAPYASYSTSFEPVLEVAPQGQPAFEPMRARQAELGLRWAPERAGYSLSAAAYDLRQRNVVNYDYATQRSYQTGEVRSRGLELEARGELTRELQLVASYAYIDAKVTRSVDASTVGKMPARIPKQQVAAWAKWETAQGPLAGLGLGLGLRRVGSSEGDAGNNFEVPGATLVDASLSFDFAQWAQSLSGWKLQLNAANLADKRYVASCASRWACFYGNGRVVTGSVRYQW